MSGIRKMALEHFSNYKKP